MKNEIRNLVFDLSEGREIFDAESNRAISAKEANDVLRKYLFEELGLNENSTHREIRRRLSQRLAENSSRLLRKLLIRLL